MDKRRKKLWWLIYGVTAAVLVVDGVFLPETVISGIQVANGIRSEIYGSKWSVLLSGMVTPLAGWLLLNTQVKRAEQKVREHPNLNSYRIRYVWKSGLAWICVLSGLITGIAVWMMNQ